MKFNEIEFLEFDLTNLCSAVCPQCPRQNPLYTELMSIQSQLTIENIVDWFPLEDIKNLKRIVFKGSFGEPVTCHDFVDIIRFFIENTTASIQVSTNGSLKTTDWWSKLGSLIGNRGEVIFGIDGLSNTHSIYRVNTSFEKILENAKAYMSTGGIAEWQFIAFKHNQEQIEEAKLLSKELGFSKFFILPSNRFKTDDDFILNVNGDILEKTTKVQANTWQTIVERRKSNSSIVCKSITRKWISIDWDGTVWPCCHLSVIRGNKSSLDFQIWNKR